MFLIDHTFQTFQAADEAQMQEEAKALTNNARKKKGKKGYGYHFYHFNAPQYLNSPVHVWT